jgi:hypothetical protein
MAKAKFGMTNAAKAARTRNPRNARSPLPADIRAAKAKWALEDAGFAPSPVALERIAPFVAVYNQSAAACLSATLRALARRTVQIVDDAGVFRIVAS